MHANEKGPDIEVQFVTVEEYGVEYFALHVSIDHEKYKLVDKIKPKEAGEGKKDKEYKYLDKSTKKEKTDANQVSYILYQVDKKGDQTPIAITSLALQTNVAAAGIENLLPQITPKSPNVTAMERYGNSPISYYTGLPDTEIKIWDIKVGDLVIPLRLKYHHGGHRVLDIESWTGLGWTLTGLYALTREVRGKDDEDGGIWDQALPNYPSPQINCLTENLKDELIEHIYYNRDVFTYRTPLRANSFVFRPGGTGTIFLESDQSRISYAQPPSLLETITVTDPQGNRFVYADKENTSANNV